tara:strand:- start:2235 stop:3050 length:816 start_codon:yes stop_codon:yes gene_type:complete
MRVHRAGLKDREWEIDRITKKIGAFYTESNWKRQEEITFTKPRAFKETFKNFLFYDVIILADQQHVNHWKACKYAFDYYCSIDRDVEIVTYEEYGLNFHQFCKFVNYTIKDIMKEDANVFRYMGAKYKHYFVRPLKNKEVQKTDTVVYSIMDSAFLSREINSVEKQVQLAFRGMEPEHHQIFREALKNTNWVDLGDSRRLDDGPSLLDKLELIRRSNFYIGTACSWSQWARNVDTKVYIIYNRRPRDHNHDMRDLDTKDKYLILGELMTTS